MKLTMNNGYVLFQNLSIPKFRFVSYSPDLRLEIIQELVSKSIGSVFNVFGFLS